MSTADHTPEPLALPRLRSRSWVAWMLISVAGVLSVTVWAWSAHPDERIYVLFIPVLLLVMALGATRSSRLEPASGNAPAALVHRWLGIWDRRVRLDEGSTVDLVGAGATVSLVAKSAGVTASTDLLVMSEYVTDCRSPELLRRIADALTESPVKGGRRVAGVLRAQAAHLAAGGGLDDSPLAARRGRTFFGLRF